MARSISAAVSKLLALRLFDSRRLNLLPEQAHLKKLFNHFDVDCVFDVGANTGQYATMLRRQAGYKGRIVSFEPIPEAAGQVRRKAARDPLWTVEELALADVSEQRAFNIMASSEFSSLSAPRTDEVSRFDQLNRTERTILVQTRTLAEVFPRLQAEYGFKRPFLKMDTQGFDLKVLNGAEPVLSKFVGFQSELSIRRLYQDAVDFREALTFYQSLGFDLSALVPNNGGHFPALIEIDCIMIRRDLVAGALKVEEVLRDAAHSTAAHKPSSIGDENPALAAQIPLSPRNLSDSSPHTCEDERSSP
ncbi:MAG: FkbM family methyltransferase [Hyphomonadaceae bacterium]|nr:FkbM family methyltransferase [Hyphomonadaceae bacterium]